MAALYANLCQRLRSLWCSQNRHQVMSLEVRLNDPD